jgi:hypothetical protein
MEQIDKDMIIEKFKIALEVNKLEREKSMREYWETLKPFTGVNDIPNLPRVETDEWNTFYVPKLIGAGAIPKKDLVDGQFYAGDHRNATIARWDANKNKFIYMRTKWNATFEDDCNHFEDDDGYALFVPIKTATEEEYKINQEIK